MGELLHTLLNVYLSKSNQVINFVIPLNFENIIGKEIIAKKKKRK